MAGLTFTAAKPKRVHPNADLIGLLRDAYDEHQQLMTRQDTNVERRRIVTTRIVNGQAWIARHSIDHPRYRRNRDLLERLKLELEDLKVEATTLSMARKGRALAAWECWDALETAEREALKGEIDMSRVFRPNAARYAEEMENWQRWGEEVEVPYA